MSDTVIEPLGELRLAAQAASKLSLASQTEQMNALKSAAALAAGQSLPAQQQASPVDFAGVLRSTIEQVNASQQASQDLTKRFELGEKNVSLPNVMLSVQKASLAFNTMSRVSKELTEIYQKMMNTAL